MSVNENLSPGIHVEPDGLAWWQDSLGRIVIGEEVIGKEEVGLRPLAKIQVPADLAKNDSQMWGLVRQWMRLRATKVGVKRS